VDGVSHLFHGRQDATSSRCGNFDVYLYPSVNPSSIAYTSGAVPFEMSGKLHGDVVVVVNFCNCILSIPVAKQMNGMNKAARHVFRISLRKRMLDDC
jgi:hypothetical protein